MAPLSPSDEWDAWADIYDQFHDFHTTSENIAEFLNRRELGKKVVDLGAGTGRTAVAFAQAGWDVVAVDISPNMLTKLAEKSATAGVKVECHLGDMREFDVGSGYDCVYSASSAFFSLRTQSDQLSCLAACYRALRSGGELIIECFMPDPGLLRPSSQINVRSVGTHDVRLTVTGADRVSQRLRFVEIVIGPEGIQTYPVELRYCWPAELDLMASVSGFTLIDRTSGYSGESFNHGSARHVSVYRRNSAG